MIKLCKSRVIITPFVLLAALVSASAQVRSSSTIDTPVSGVSAFVSPPSSFDPLTATDAELDQYGFPPRPSAELGAAVMTNWQRRATRQTRLVP